MAAVPTAEATIPPLTPIKSASARSAFFSDSVSVTATSMLTGMNSSGAWGSSRSSALRVAQIAAMPAAVGQGGCAASRDLGIARPCSTTFGARIVSIDETP